MAQTKVGEFEVDALISSKISTKRPISPSPEGPYETAGGFVMHSLGRIPEPHDLVEIPGVKISVLTVEGKRAGQLLISRTEWEDKTYE
jgi:putative hemolysin